MEAEAKDREVKLLSQVHIRNRRHDVTGCLTLKTGLTLLYYQNYFLILLMKCSHIKQMKRCFMENSLKPLNYFI
jgi:hypothetical protein